MGKRNTFVILILFVTVILSGCSSNKKEAARLVESGREKYAALDYMGAVSDFNEALDYTDDKKEIFRDLGIAYMELEKYDNAIEAFINSLHAGNGFLSEVDYDINLYLGNAYFLKGDFEKAIEVYDAILTMKPKLTEIYYERAIAYLNLGKSEEAYEDFSKVTAADPDNIDTYLKIYFAMNEAGLESDATAYLKATLDNASGSTSDYDKGRMCYYLEDYSNARVYLEKAKDMSDSDTILMLGRTYEAIGDYQYASSLYNTYLTAKGNDAGVYNQLGMCRIEMKDYEAAILAFSSGLNLDDEKWNKKLLYNEAVAYEYLLDFDTAKEKMSAYLEKYPKDEDAMRELEFLKTR